jgi:hypothetical protein
MEALTDSVIRHDSCGAFGVRRFLLSFRHWVKGALAAAATAGPSHSSATWAIGIDIPSRHGCLSFGCAERSSSTAA